jgi:hypothetical protein
VLRREPCAQRPRPLAFGASARKARAGYDEARPTTQ